MRDGVFGPIWTAVRSQVTSDAAAVRTACVMAILLSLGSALPAQAASVQVLVTGIAPAQGRVFVSLCRGDFSERNCSVGRNVPGPAGSARFTFLDLEPGIYAVAAFQDLNGNGVLDKTQNGLPLEPYGFSNGAGRSAAPRFEQAAVQISPGAVVSVRLTSIAARR